MGMSFGKSKAQLEALSHQALVAESERIFRAADELDERRQMQIQNQIASINRLLVFGSYDAEMEALHQELVERDHKLGMIRQIINGIYASGQLDDLGKIISILDSKEVSDGEDDLPDDADR